MLAAFGRVLVRGRRIALGRTVFTFTRYEGGRETRRRTSCDTAAGNETLRLCWHTGGGSMNGGWRCGSSTGLNGDATWERVILQAD